MTANPGLSARVAAEVRAEQARQRLTGRDLARRVDLPPSTVARWLRNDTDMTLDAAAVLAGALGVGLVDLIQRAEAMGLPRKDSNLQPAGYTSSLVKSDIGVRRFVRPLRLVAYPNELPVDERRSPSTAPTTRRPGHPTFVPIICDSGYLAS